MAGTHPVVGIIIMYEPFLDWASKGQWRDRGIDKMSPESDDLMAVGCVLRNLDNR